MTTNGGGDALRENENHQKCNKSEDCSEAVWRSMDEKPAGIAEQLPLREKLADSGGRKNTRGNKNAPSQEHHDAVGQVHRLHLNAAVKINTLSSQF